MASSKWTFLSNHGRVLAYVSKNPKSTTQVIAHKVELSIRGVQQILDELEAEGYLNREKLGRCNHYVVHPEMPMRHRLEKKCSVGKILMAIGAIPGKEGKLARRANAQCSNIAAARYRPILKGGQQNEEVDD